MPRKSRVAGTILSAALISAAVSPHAPANGETAGPAQVMENFGLTGTWSPDCKREPSMHNPRVTWRKIGHRAIHMVSVDGRTAMLTDEVIVAVRLDDDTISLRTLRHDGSSFSFTLRLRDGRIRTLQSIGPGGQIYYDNGVELATGKPSVEDEPCSAAIS